MPGTPQEFSVTNPSPNPGSAIVSIDGTPTGLLTTPLDPEALETAANAIAAVGPGGYRCAAGSGVIAMIPVGAKVYAEAQSTPTIDSSMAESSMAFSQTRAWSDPGPERALAFRAGASLTCDNIRSSGGDRNSSPRLSDLSAFTLLFRLRVDEIRSVAVPGSPLPIFQIDEDGDCGFAVFLQPGTTPTYDRLQVVVRARRTGSSTINVTYYGNLGTHGGPELGEIDPESGPFVTFAVRVDLTGGSGGKALTMFREGQEYSAEGLNGATPQYLHDEDSELQLTIGCPSELSPGYPSGMRKILGNTGYADSRGGDYSITVDRVGFYKVALPSEQIAGLAAPATPLESIQPNHLIFRPDGRGTIGDLAELGLDGTLVNRGVVDLDVPRDGRIMWRDSASALVDVPSTAGVSGRGGVYLEEAPGLVTSARIRRAVANPSGTITLELEDNDGNSVNLADSNTHAVLVDDVAPRIEVTVQFAAGGTATWNPWEIWAPKPTFGSSDPKGYMVLLPPREIAGQAITSASLVIPDGWIVSAAGATAGIEASLVVGSILPSVEDLIPSGERLACGINISLMDHGFPGAYADRIKHAYRAVEGEHEHLPIDDKGWWELEPGQYGNIALTLPSDQNWDDPFFSQAHMDPPHQVPGRGANPLLGQEGGEFEDFRPSSGTPTITFKGRIVLKAKAKPGRGGDVALKIGFKIFDPFNTPGHTTSGENAAGTPFPYLKSITDGTPIEYDADTDTYHASWSFERWNPQGLDPAHKAAIGYYSTPQIRAHFNDAVVSLEAYIIPDEGTEHAIYRFDPFDPPLFDPEFSKGKMQGGGYTLFRFLNASLGNSTGASLASDFMPADYACLLAGKGRPNPWTSLVQIASVAIPTEAEVAAAAGFDGMARNCYVKVTTATPHGLAHGAKFETQGDLVLGIPREEGEAGDTSGVIFHGNAIVLTPTTIMATVAAQRFIGGPVATTGVVSGNPATNQLVRVVPAHIPPEHLARLADECCPDGGGKVWFNVNHAFLQCDSYDADGDGEIDGSWLQLRIVFERMVQGAPAGVKFIVEPGNEIWNPGNAFYFGGEHFRMVGHRCYGHGAVIRPKTYNGSGGITAWEVVTPGRGYFGGQPRIHSGSGTGFYGLIRTDPLTGAVEGVHVVAPGSGYGTPNTTVLGGDATVTVSIGEGRGAVLTPVISGGQVTGFTITDGGEGYHGGQLRIVGGSGSGASALFTVDEDGTIDAVTMQSTGSGYSPSDTIHAETPHSLSYGGEPWAGTVQRDAYVANMLLASRMVRLFREVLIEDGRSPDDVEAYIGLGPDGFIAPAVQAALAFCNGSGDPLDRLDSAGQHTYWYLSIPTGMPVASMSQFTTEEDIDLFELEVAHSRILDQSLAAGFPKVYVYEGGLENYTPFDLDVAGEDGDAPGLFRRVLRCMSAHTHPRIGRVELAFLRRMHDCGVSAYCVYEMVNTIRRAGLTGPNYETSPTLTNFYAEWGKLNGGYGEVPGLGDGSDGKHDNRFSVNGYSGPYNPGVSVVPELGAHKTWTTFGVEPTEPTALTLTGPSPILVGVARTYTVTVDAPFTGEIAITLDGLAGDLSATTMNFEDEVSRIFTFTPSAPGSGSIVAAADGLEGDEIAVTVNAGTPHPNVERYWPWRS